MSVATEQADLQQKIAEAVCKELTGSGTSDEEEAEKIQADRATRIAAELAETQQTAEDQGIFLWRRRERQ